MLRSNLGNVLDAQGKHAAAEVEHRAALAAMEASLGPGHPASAMSRSNLGNALDAQGKHAEAEAEHRAALASREATLGPDHPDVAGSRYSLATVLLVIDRPGEALPLAELAWARHQQDDIPPEQHAATAFTLARAQWHNATGSEDRERARSLAEVALRKYRAAGDAHRDAAADVRAWLAEHPGA